MDRMFRLFTKLDQALQAGAQNSYLWLLDRTGIYAASVMFIVFAASGAFTLVGHPHGGAVYTAFVVVFTMLIGLMTAPRYLMQDKGYIELFNAMSLHMQGLRWRHGINGFLFGSIAASLIDLDLYGAFSTMLCITFNYYWIILIRERDKKPFFKLRESHEHLATDAA